MARFVAFAFVPLLAAGVALAQETVSPPAELPAPGETDNAEAPAVIRLPDLENIDRRSGESGAEEPVRMPRTAVFRGLDKITARVYRIEAVEGEIVPFSGLEILVRRCDKRPPEEPPEVTAFVEVAQAPVEEAETGALDDEMAADLDGVPAGVTPDAVDPSADGESISGVDPMAVLDEATETEQARIELAGEMVFSGWMFASSPGLSAMEHPVYDIWVVDCLIPEGAEDARDLDAPALRGPSVIAPAIRRIDVPGEPEAPGASDQPMQEQEPAPR